MKTIIVNLFGAPGAGKSTGAAYVFALLKMHGIDAELVTEFAKDKLWEGNKAVFENQAYIFGKQSFKISRCINKVNVIVTDSPLLLSIQYNHTSNLRESFNNYVLDVFNSYDNMNYYLTRVKEYNPNGRFQTEEESDQIGDEIKQLLDNYNVEYKNVDGYIGGYKEIVADVYFRIKGIGETSFSEDFKRILSQTDNWADWRKEAFEDQNGRTLQEIKKQVSGES